MRLGACELWVDVPHSVQPLDFSLARQIAARPDHRKRVVEAALEAAQGAGIDVLVFPLWTWPGHPSPVPRRLLERSGNLAAVLGIFRIGVPDGRRLATKGKHSPIDERLYVISEGRVAAGPTQQLMLNSSSREMSHAADLADLLVNRDGGRQWALPDRGMGLLLACGENNVLRGGGPTPTIVPADQAVHRGLSLPFLKGFSVVANPTHTRQGPQASRDKKAELSRGGVCVAVANAHSSYRQRWREKEETGVETMRSSRNTAEFYRLGARVPAQPVHRAGDLERDGFRLTAIDA